MSHIQISCVTYMKESFHTYKWVMSISSGGDSSLLKKIHILPWVHTYRALLWLHKVLFWVYRALFWGDDSSLLKKLHQRISRVTHMNKSCHTYIRILSILSGDGSSLLGLLHQFTSGVTHNNESCHTDKWVLSHVSISHVTRINESCYTYEWVMSILSVDGNSLLGLPHSMLPLMGWLR